jgi:hypothetical protein
MWSMKNFTETSLQHMKKNTGTHIRKKDRLASSAYITGNNQKNSVLFFIPSAIIISKQNQPIIKLNLVKYG